MPSSKATARARVPEPLPTEVRDLNPDDIMVKKENRGRHFDPDVSDLVESIIAQGRVLQPISVNKENVLLFGNRRLLAVKQINEQKLTKHRMTIPAQIVDVNEEQAFMNNLAENKDRQRTTAIDDAYNIKHLMERFNKTPKEIGAIYSIKGTPMSEAWVNERLSLLDLSEEDQRKQHNGQLAADAALFLADYPAEVRPALMAEAEKVAMQEMRTDAGLDAPTPIDAKSTKRLPARPASKAAAKKQAKAREALKKPVKVRTKHLKESARKLGVTKKGQKITAIKRSLRDVTELFERYTGPGVPTSVRRFSEAFLRWKDGELGLEEMDREFERRFKAGKAA